MTRFQKLVCHYRVHCVACRTDESWRTSLVASGLVETRDFDCPYGVTKATALGVQTNALVEMATNPDRLKEIARILRQGKGTCCGGLN